MCARGCKKRGEHFAACPSYGEGTLTGACRGCVPREAVEGSLICGRCFNSTRRLIGETPDMLGHLLALKSPLKAVVYDREPGGGGGRTHAPPPVPVELLDAADFIVTLLWSAVEVIERRVPFGRMQVPVAATAPLAFVYAETATGIILRGLAELSARDDIVPFVDACIGAPASKDEWTLRTIFERWSLKEDPWWAAQPCPSCGLRAVKVSPPGSPADETKYQCQSAGCRWVPLANEIEICAAAFSRREGKAA